VVIRDVNLLLQINNCIVAAQGNSLHGLMPVPIGAQVNNGMRRREYIFYVEYFLSKFGHLVNSVNLVNSIQAKLKLIAPKFIF
jgi:hypothetical protein